MKRLEGLHQMTLGEWLRKVPVETARRLDELHRCLWKLGIRKAARPLRLLSGADSGTPTDDQLSAPLEQEAPFWLGLIGFLIETDWEDDPRSASQSARRQLVDRALVLKDSLENELQQLASAEFERRKRRRYELSAEFSGTLLITDPCYLSHDCDELEALDGLVADNLYGDWRCAVMDTDTGARLGEFCADGGQVCVTTLEEVRSKVSGDRDWEARLERCAALLPDFSGKVALFHDFNVLEDGTVDAYCAVRGTGSVNFITGQTGF